MGAILDTTSCALILIIAIAIGVGKPTPSHAPAKPATEIAKPCVGIIVKDYALQHGIEPAVVAAVIRVESGWNPNARGSSGELGLMQLMPKTAKHLGVKDRSDPSDNVMGGIRYLAECKRLTGSKYLRCYNGGPGGINLPKTKAYEAKVLAAIARPRKLA